MTAVPRTLRSLCGAVLMVWAGCGGDGGGGGGGDGGAIAPPTGSPGQPAGDAGSGGSGGGNPYTAFAPSADSRLIYVSSSEGVDGDGRGLAEDQPLRSVGAGKALLRDGYPDWLLFKKGDVFEESLGQWVRSGRSASEPMLVGAYGTGPRPRFDTGAQHGVYTDGSNGAPQVNRHVVFTGLHFYAHTRDPDNPAYTGGGDPSGVRFLRGVDDVLFEDCVFQFYTDNLSVQNFDGFGVRDLRLRYNLLLDSYGSGGGRGQGAYMHDADGVLLEGNIFVHNGYNDRAGSPANLLSHSLYLQNGTDGPVLRDNIFVDSSSHGVQMRSGGTAEGNLFVRNPIALLMGGGDEPDPGGVEATVVGNVVLQGSDIGPGQPRGWGIDLENIRRAEVRDNIIAHNEGGQPAAMTRDAPSTTYENNIIYNWGGESDPGPFADPTRSVERYDALQGGEGTLASFIEALRGQSRDQFREAYTARAIIAYIREGFARR